MNLTEYEKNQFNLIQKWEKAKPSVLSIVSGKLFQPISFLMNKIIPTKVIEGILFSCNKIGMFLADKQSILKEANVNSIEELHHLSLEDLDKMSSSVQNWAVGIAGTEGGISGVLGLPGIAADIPALITLAYRTIHKIGLCYGYECKTEYDLQFVNQIMAAASANTVQEKTCAILMLKRIYVVVGKVPFRKMAEIAAKNAIGIEGGVIALRTLAKGIGINLTRRKILQAVPIIGGGVGAAMNIAFMNDVAKAAKRMYQRRWLVDNGKIEELKN